LPGPAVGYSRVWVKNIYTGKQNTGFCGEEFFTAKDYPMTLSTQAWILKKIFSDTGRFINYFTSNLWTTQGFLSFKQNNMQWPQPRSETTYAGGSNGT